MTSPVDALGSACVDLAPDARVGVAVSGGGDSVALLVLAAEMLGPGRISAATVDHGLRPEAAAEAAQVAALCARLGVAHEALSWQAGPGQGNLMAQARAARLRLLADWARRLDLSAVLLGHTLDDQAETVLMRLARGSGVDGLSGMAPARRAEGMLWLRPFLPVTREALRGALTRRGINWAEDPTNADPRFARTRARAALGALAPLGIDAAGLAATAARMAEARVALETRTRQVFDALVRQTGGTVLVDMAGFGLEPEIRDRLFAAVIMGLSGASYRPRLAALRHALRLVSQPGGASGGAACLGGVMLCAEAGAVRLWREAAAVRQLRVPVGGVWDRRWRAGGAAAARDHGARPPVIAALGAGGLTVLSRQARAGLHPHWRETGLPRAALAGLPAIWRGDRLEAAPLALWPQDWTLTARPLAAPDDWRGEFD